MIANKDTTSTASNTLRIDEKIGRLEVDFSIPRTIRIIPVNSKAKAEEYFLKITRRGGATLV